MEEGDKATGGLGSDPGAPITEDEKVSEKINDEEH